MFLQPRPHTLSHSLTSENSSVLTSLPSHNIFLRQTYSSFILQLNTVRSECRVISACVKLLHAPLAVVVHAVEAVPLGVELCEGVCDLGDFSRRSVLNGIGLALVDSCDLLAERLQILFDILEKDQCEIKGTQQGEQEEGGRL